MKTLVYFFIIVVSVLPILGRTNDYVRIDFYWQIYEDTTFLHTVDSILNVNDSSMYNEYDPGYSQSVQRARRYYQIDVPDATTDGCLIINDGLEHHVVISHFNEPQLAAKSVIRFKDRVYYFTVDTVDFLEKFEKGVWKFHSIGDTIATQKWEFEYIYNK